MNIDSLARQALNKLKDKYELPEKGILAGGSLANTIWEIVSDNKAVINDLDIFIIDKVEEYDISNVKEKPIYENIERFNPRAVNGPYGDINLIYDKYFYRIIESTNDGIFNNIKYVSNTDDPSIIIKSFDINCTEIAYDIENDKFYWSDEFIEFLQTGELKVSNLNTPSHTVIRLAKKRKELNAKLKDSEINICSCAIYGMFNFRNGFKSKYEKYFNDNSEILSKHFDLIVDEELTEYVKYQYESTDIIYKLISKDHNNIYRKYNANLFYNPRIFLNYIRKIHINEEKRKIFSSIFKGHAINMSLINFDDYIDDLNIKKEDSELLSTVLKDIKIMSNLADYKMSEQVKIIKKVFKFNKDINSSISILKKFKIDIDKEIDEKSYLLMKLSVRKELSHKNLLSMLNI